MARRQIPSYKFGLGSGRHRTTRRALCFGKNYSKYTSHFKEKYGNSNILLIKQRSRIKKKKKLNPLKNNH